MAPTRILVLLLATAGVVGGQSLLSRTAVKLVDNGYENVVVGIHPRVAEDERLIDAIKNMFTNGSRFLYTATRKRVYFRNVTIIIPSNWTSKPEYGVPGKNTFDTSDVIVAPSNPLWAPDPYTQQVEGCGKPGSFIHFADGFLTSDYSVAAYGDHGRILVHEWGHYRWGLFNEYPDEVGDAEAFEYFYKSGFDWKRVTCPEESKFTTQNYKRTSSNSFQRRCDYENSFDEPEENCFYVVTGAEEATGSIMFAPRLPEVINFCDNATSDANNLHNWEAPNKHNTMCQTRSAWEVMRDHPDFKDGNSPPVELDQSQLVPTFNLVQFNPSDACRVVLVLDTSGSMRTNDRIEKVISAATVFVENVPDETWVGIVTFNSFASIKHQLTQVTTDRSSLYNVLALTAGGGTSIGHGLEIGLYVLQQHPSGLVQGSTIILMSDGQDNGSPPIGSHPVRQQLQNLSVIVDTVLIGHRTDENLYSISEETGGTAIFYADNSTGNEIQTSLSDTTARCAAGGDESEARIQLFSRTYIMESDEEVNGSVMIDLTIGKETRFISTYTAGDATFSGVDIILAFPNGTVINANSPEFTQDLQRRIITIAIPGTAVSGEWQFRIRNTFSGQQSATMTIYSKATFEDPITITSELGVGVVKQTGTIYHIAFAQIRKGYQPVIDADVWVSISGLSDDVQLLDNGGGADVFQNDGVYTRLIALGNPGFHGLSVTVNNAGRAKILGRLPTSRAPAFINITEDGQLVKQPPIGNYEVKAPGEQYILYEPAPPFTRSSATGSTNVQDVPRNVSNGGDGFPPSRITNLRVSSTSFDNLTVVLMWTAPGDDLDFGTASRYDIRISDSIQTLITNFENATRVTQTDVSDGNLTNPSPFGTTEVYSIIVEGVRNVTSFSYAFAVRAADEVDQVGDVSNIVVASLTRPVDINLPVTDVQESPTTTVPPSVSSFPAYLIIVIVGGVLAFLVVIAVCCLGAVVASRQRALAYYENKNMHHLDIRQEASVFRHDYPTAPPFDDHFLIGAPAFYHENRPTAQGIGNFSSGNGGAQWNYAAHRGGRRRPYDLYEMDY